MEISRSGRDRPNICVFCCDGAEGATAPETLRQKDWIGNNGYLESKLPVVTFTGSFTEGVRGC